MGDGRRLKEIIDARPDMTVRKLARSCGISPQTIYSVIKKDGNLRFDFALRMANELDINVKEICSAVPFDDKDSDNDFIPGIPDGLNDAFDKDRIKRYLVNRMFPLMQLFGKFNMPDVDNLLTSFYQLDDSARKEVIDLIQVKLKYNKDPKRAEEVKSIKGM
jgi:DNA-binding Xre family transcriptional regulator